MPAGAKLLMAAAGLDTGGVMAWDPATATTNMSLTNGDLTGEQSYGSSSTESVNGLYAASSGQLYFELYQDIAGGAASTHVGLINSSADITGSHWIGETADSFGWFGDGRVYINSSNIANVNNWFNDGDLLQIAVDLDTMEAWLKRNSGNWNNDASADPATNTNGIDISSLNSGPYYPAIRFYESGQKMTANFGATSYSGTKPSGYSDWPTS